MCDCQPVCLSVEWTDTVAWTNSCPEQVFHMVSMNTLKSSLFSCKMWYFQNVSLIKNSTPQRNHLYSYRFATLFLVLFYGCKRFVNFEKKNRINKNPFRPHQHVHRWTSNLQQHLCDNLCLVSLVVMVTV